MTDEVESYDNDGCDWYLQHLAAIGRTEEEDRRVVVHESGHAIAARALGHELGGMTADPDPNGKYGGLVWGPRHSVAFGKDVDADAVPDLCDKLRAAMPKVGERRADAADAYMHALNRCIELAAAATAERMLLPGDPVASRSDVEHSVRYAAMVTNSPEAGLKFIALAEQMADDLLRPYWHVLIVLSTALKIRRTMTGAEIDAVIADVVAQFELLWQQAQRREWNDRVKNSASFDFEVLHCG